MEFLLPVTAAASPIRSPPIDAHSGSLADGLIHVFTLFTQPLRATIALNRNIVEAMTVPAPFLEYVDANANSFIKRLSDAVAIAR